jgi:hypothetical protein
MTIQQFVEARGIKSLFHFTRLANLGSILQYGLLPLELCDRAGIQPVINDSYRHDGTGAISATISFPNYKMFYSLWADGGPEWVVLELDSPLLWRTRCAFSDTNAGDSSVYQNIPIEDRQGLASLQSMFGDYGHIERATLKIPEHYPTNPQAEVLLIDGATVNDIKGIYFQSLATYQQFKAQYPNMPCHLNGGYFNGRLDWRHWQ